MALKKLEEELITGILEIFCDNVVKIILYGSVAREEAKEESDIDVAVIVSNPISEEDRMAFIEWCADMDLKYDCVLSIIDIEREKFEAWENILPFYKNVSTEGVVLWTAA
jgi:predicted nucleotidyltransferase